MSISELKLPPETAGAPIVSCASRKSILPMGIGNGAFRKSAKMRQNAPCILSPQWMTQQILANAQESAVEKWERTLGVRTGSVSVADSHGVLANASGS